MIMAKSNQRFSELSKTLKLDIAQLEREIPRLQYLCDQLPRCAPRSGRETAAEIRRLEDNLQEIVRKSLLNVFQLQLLSGHNSDHKLQCRNLKRNLDRNVERFSNQHAEIESNLEKFCPPHVTEEEGEVELRKKTGTFSSIQKEVDTATELMREGVDHVLTRNSVIYTHTNFDQARQSEKFDSTNLQRCYKTLMAKKRSLQETDDKNLSEKQRETKRKLLQDITELTRMYDDLQTLVDEQMATINTMETNIEGRDMRGDSGKDKKKCVIM